jgi:hypothetical protein
MRSLKGRVTRARLLLPLLVGVAAAVAALSLGPGGPPAGSAADSFVAGQRSTTRTPVGDKEAKSLRERAAAHRRAIGVGAVGSASVERVRDRFTGLTYDEVVDRDGQGQTLALQRFDAAGRLLAAVRFGGHNPKQVTLADAAGAQAAALRHAQALDLGPAGTARVRRGAAEEWVVEWPRVVDGIPVPGDGVVVRTWVDGSLHTAVRHERPLAERPGRQITTGEARRLAGDRLAGWLDARHRGEWRIEGSSLAWVAPNDAFEPGAPDAPASVLQLAWVVRVTTSGTLAETIRGLEFFLDAGDGRLLGGDIVR